jgi:hypothetical protein
MHPPHNTILSLCEPIPYLPLHFHVHLELEEEPLKVQDLGQLMKVLLLAQPPFMKQDEVIALKQRT